MKSRCEILAPAGSPECITAAVRSGADAVYFGLKDFNARRNAGNFDDEQVEQAIAYCHASGVRVHITLNTLVSDDELASAMKMIERVCSLGADALILQDIGLAALAKKAAGEIQRHASTQMSVQTPCGIRLLESMGYTTAVLPRELERSEIAAIRESTDMRLEMFVHGALCMCVSGQCYLSAMLGSRSGNRGLCAQPCRLPFSAKGGTGHDLSLKDLSLAEKAGELSQLGIDSLKIEGRMKRPEYVAAAVSAVKDSLSSQSRPEIFRTLRAVFSRSGFTDGYYEGKLGKDMFGTRTKQDVTAASEGLLSNLRNLYDREAARVPVDFALNVLNGESISLSASAAGKSVFVEGDFVPQPALEKPCTKTSLEQQLTKCGGTVFYPQSIEIFLDDGLFVPVGAINSLRRSALEALEKQLRSVKPKHFTQVPLRMTPHKAKATPSFHIRIADVSQIPADFENVENLYIPLESMEKYVEKVQNLPVTVGVELPRGIFGKENYVRSRLKKAKELGFHVAYCGTLDAVAIASAEGFELHGGFSLNVFNSFTVAELERLSVKYITLSPELTLDKAAAIGGAVQRGLIAYGRLPLMLTRNCPIKNATDCSHCGGKSCLTDRMGIRFPVVCRMGASEVLNSRPIYMADRIGEIKNMDFVTLYFTVEKGDTVDAVINAYRKGEKISGEFTRGLYYRGVE